MIFLSAYFFFVFHMGFFKEKNSLSEGEKEYKNPNITDQLNDELKWKYFFLLKTQLNHFQNDLLQSLEFAFV